MSQLNFEGQNRTEVAMERLRAFQPPEGYYLAFSGGKDSVVLYDLAQRAGVKFDPHYNITGIDPPELVYFIRDQYPTMIYEQPKENIFKLVARKGLPRQNARFCCEYLKEHSGAGRVVLTGIRWEESVSRKRRNMVESCRYGMAKHYVHPIIDWSGAEVWGYIREHKLPYCSLYDEGFPRLGCILCPMTSPKRAAIERQRYPKIANAWLKAAQRFYARGTKAVEIWDSAEAMFEWWLTRKAVYNESDDPQYPMWV